jgi:glycosyl transferase, family 25
MANRSCATRLQCRTCRTAKLRDLPVSSADDRSSTDQASSQMKLETGNDPHVFLINLDRSRTRLQHMETQASRLGLAFERVPAVEGANVPDWLRSEFDTPHAMSAGEVGCYASHLVVAQHVVARGLPYAVVLEDDVALAPDFKAVVRAAIDAAPPGWDLIHASSVFKAPVIHVQGLPSRSRLVQYTRMPVNTAAYVVSNRGARKRLSPMVRSRPVDMDHRYAWLQRLEIFGVYPAPAEQRRDIPSEIGSAARRRSRAWSPGVLSQCFGMAYTARRVGFGNYLRARLGRLSAGVDHSPVIGS